MNIKAYLKPHCGWSMGVRAIMDKYTLEYEDLDIINNQNLYAEMVEKSGQPLSPCVEIDGVMLADVSGEEVENYIFLTNSSSLPISKHAPLPIHPVRTKCTIFVIDKTTKDLPFVFFNLPIILEIAIL